MTSLTVTLRYGSTPTSGTVEAIPRTTNGVVPGNDIMALGPWRTSINGTGSLAGQGTLVFPANDFTDLTWSFRIRWDAGDKTVTFGPYTYAQISASGVTSLADLIEVEVLEYVATSTLVQRVEALEAGGGGGGGGGGGSYDDTELRGLIDTEETARADGDAANATAISTHTVRTDNPHAVTKAQVGLANVDNTSDANKPISTATQTALDGKASTAHTHTADGISDATTVGKALIRATDAAAGRTAIGAGTSSLVLGTTAGTAAAGNDARLSDARTPLTHTHGVTDLTATGTRDATTFLRGDNTWATPAGGMTPTVLIRSGLYSTPPQAYDDGAATLDELHVVPWVLPTSSLNGVHVYVSAGGGAGAKIRFGVYANSNGAPGALIADWGTVDTTTSGDKTLAMSWAPTAGLYWIAVVMQGAVSTVRLSMGNGNSAQIGLPYSLSTFGNALAHTQGGVTGALPSTFTTSPGNRYNVPRVSLRGA